MLWAPIIGGSMALGGALLGRNSERPTIDPEMLKMLFGPGAVGMEANQLFAVLRNSPVFSQLMSSMATQGAALGNHIEANVARSGAGSSGIGAFASAAGRGYAGSMQRNALAQLFMKAFLEANQNVGQRQSIWAQSQLQQQSQPTFKRMISASLLNAGAQGMSSWLSPAKGGGGSIGTIANDATLA